MGRAPCCDKAKVKKGPWSPEEDRQLKEYIEKNGSGGNWIALPHRAGLKRCGKSCRLRWLNYLRPNIKHGDFSEDEDRVICSLFATIGSRWSIIAAQLPGRTDNDIKNYWNTKLKKKLFGLPPSQRKPHQQQQQQQQQLLFPCDPLVTSPMAAHEAITQLLQSTVNSTNNDNVVKDSGGSVLMFGGHEQRYSSSSDWSFGKELGQLEEMGFGSFLHGGNEEPPLLEYGGHEEMVRSMVATPNNGCNNNLYDYIEDTSMTGDISFKSHERVMYYATDHFSF